MSASPFPTLARTAEPYDLASGRSGGEGTKRALRAAERLGETLGAALRRAIPFLGRRGVPVRFTAAVVHPGGEQEASSYLCAFDCPERGTGFLAFDRQVSALLVDGLLGGDGKKPPALASERLSRVQTAFMRSASVQILGALSEVAQKAHGSVLRARDEVAVETTQPNTHIALTLEVGDGGMILVLVPQALFAAADDHGAPRGPDPRIVATLYGAPVEVSVELGRARLAMRKLMSLQVGTTLVLDTTVEGRATVRVDGRIVAQGRPKAEAGHMAVRIESGEQDSERLGTDFPVPSVDASQPAA